MRRLSRMLKNVLGRMDSQRLPKSSFDMTLHDALRIRAGRVPADSHRPSAGLAVRHVQIFKYQSESELRDQWSRLDSDTFPVAHHTVILALDESLGGSLKGLVRRRRHAHRLVIVPRAGHWPGVESLGDIALAAGSLGWSLIEMCRDLGDALESVIKDSGQDGALFVFVPWEAAQQPQ